jgi:hypothetical protein
MCFCCFLCSYEHSIGPVLFYIWWMRSHHATVLLKYKALSISQYPCSEFTCVRKATLFCYSWNVPACCIWSCSCCMQQLHSVTALVKHCLCVLECRLSCPRQGKGAEGTGCYYVVSGGDGLACIWKQWSLINTDQMQCTVCWKQMLWDIMNPACFNGNFGWQTVNMWLWSWWSALALVLVTNKINAQWK